ncbi:MAG: hypothetical protein IJU23_08525 [Proteobacteria bacterium]|nr:hypothetical protein [Pseudomonadota bacterium]
MPTVFPSESVCEKMTIDSVSMKSLIQTDFVNDWDLITISWCRSDYA